MELNKDDLLALSLALIQAEQDPEQLARWKKVIECPVEENKVQPQSEAKANQKLSLDGLSLSRNGHSVTLSSKVRNIIVYLAEHIGTKVTVDALVKHFKDDSRNTIFPAISQARHYFDALGLKGSKVILTEKQRGKIGRASCRERV